MGRITAAQPLPDPTADYSDFPEHTVPAGEEMYRAHRSDRGAWWFDNGDGGRFNLRGSRGTCCTAASVDTAVREKVRDEVFSTGMVSRVFASSFVVSRVSTPRDNRCAAVSSTPAARHGVVRELVTMSDYAVPQAWVEAFDEAGFDGIFYGSAYTTGDASAYALFGDEGVPVTAGYTEALHLTGEAACRSIGIRVAGPPSTRDLNLVG